MANVSNSVVDTGLQKQVENEAWWHSIDLGNNIITPGRKTQGQLTDELRQLQFPNLEGKSVLDIGAWDGFYSFAVEQLGASRVVALDHYVWSLDLKEHFKYWKECKERGVVPKEFLEMEYSDPIGLPGKRAFDLARTTLGSSVEDCVADFMTMDLTELGEFDVVLYLGVLYHMENPLGAMRRLCEVTRELAVIETEAIALSGRSEAICEFFPSNELNGDVTTWWAPNQQAIEGLCHAAGFRNVKVLTPVPLPSAPSGLARIKQAARSSIDNLFRRGEKGQSITRYRAFVHAYK